MYGIAGALNGLLTTWMLLKIQEHQISWQAWRDSTLHVHVTLSSEGSPRVSPHSSDTTVVAAEEADGSADGGRGAAAGADHATNVADPFMITLPFTLPEP